MAQVVSRIRRTVRGVQTAWSILGITLIAILLVEAGFRLIFGVRDALLSESQPDRRVLEGGYGGETWPVRHFRELNRLGERWQPFVYFRQQPFAGQTIHVDDQGLRQTWSPPPAERPARTIKLLMLGGSSLWGYGARDDRTIPSLVARSLHDRGYGVEMRNLAEIGYVSTQELVALLRQLQDGWRPDMVVFYDGVNDTTSAWLEGEAGVTTNEQNRRAEFNILQSPARLSGSLLMRLVKDSSSYRFAQAVGHRIGLDRGDTRRASAARDSQGLALEVVRRYQANVLIVEKLGRAFGFEPLFYWQPVVFDKTPLTAPEAGEAQSYSWATGFFAEVDRAIGQNAELQSDRRFRNLSRLFAETPELIFIDYCHTTESGNERIARVIAQDLVETMKAAGPRATDGEPSNRAVR